MFQFTGFPPIHYGFMYGWPYLYGRVSPFRYLRILGYLLLPEAFRSLSRLSSALSAKASTLRSCSLNLCNQLVKQVDCFSCLYSVINRRFWVVFMSFLSCKQCLQLVACFYKFIIFILNLSSDVLWWIVIRFNKIHRIFLSVCGFQGTFLSDWLFHQSFKTKSFDLILNHW